MAISRITTQDATGTGITTATATYPAVPTPGNLLICIGSCDVASFNALTGWTQAILAVNTGCTSIWYKAAGVAEATAIQIVKATAANMTIAIYEYKGFSGKPLLDKTISATSTAVTIPTGTTATTTAPTSLLIAGGGIAANNTLTSWSNSFNALNTIVAGGGAVTQFTADRSVDSLGAYTTTATTTPTSAINRGALATFYSTPMQLNNYQFVKVGNGMSASEKIR